MKIVAKRVPKEWPREGCGRRCKFTTYKGGLQEILLHHPMTPLAGSLLVLRNGAPASPLNFQAANQAI
jgi:hypothetical protein